MVGRGLSKRRRETGLIICLTKLHGQAVVHFAKPPPAASGSGLNIWKQSTQALRKRVRCAKTVDPRMAGPCWERMRRCGAMNGPTVLGTSCSTIPEENHRLKPVLSWSQRLGFGEGKMVIEQVNPPLLEINHS